jgi:hypothetical protein
LKQEGHGIAVPLPFHREVWIETCNWETLRATSLQNLPCRRRGLKHLSGHGDAVPLPFHREVWIEMCNWETLRATSLQNLPCRRRGLKHLSGHGDAVPLRDASPHPPNSYVGMPRISVRRRKRPPERGYLVSWRAFVPVRAEVAYRSVRSGPPKTQEETLRAGKGISASRRPVPYASLRGCFAKTATCACLRH